MPTVMNLAQLSDTAREATRLEEDVKRTWGIRNQLDDLKEAMREALA